MPYAKKKKSRKILLIVGIVITVLAIVGAGLFAWHVHKEDQATRARLIEEATPRIVVPMGYFAAVQGESVAPRGLRSLVILPGTDFYTDIAADEASLGTEIDQILADVKAYSMNSVLLDTRREEQVIFSSSALSSTPVDALRIFCDKASEQGITVNVLFHATGVSSAEGVKLTNALSPENRKLLYRGIGELATYPIEALELDGYYAQRGGESFAQYVSAGDFGNYEEWLQKSVRVLIQELAESIRGIKPDLAFGLRVSSVWANADTLEGGSETQASFQAVKDGYADTRGFVTDKLVDFVDVSISTSRADTSIPFESTARWWGELCQGSGMTMYLTHAGENICTDAAGWNRMDELARQVSAAKKIESYQGSAISGYAHLKEDPEGSMSYLAEYLAGEVNDTELNTDLTISLPQKYNFVTYEEEQQFRIKFDPNQEVLLNGEKVVPSERGGASIWVPLQVGQNTVTLEHKGAKYTFQIERRVIIFNSVSPTKDMKVAGGSTIELNAVAYKGSTISATINGKTYQLTEGGGEEIQGDSKYVNFRGSFVVPKATNKEQPLGRIVFNGSYMGYSATESGADIIIDKIPDAVDPDSMTGQVYTHAIVTSTYANTYPYLTAPEYPEGILYQLPYGTQDVVLSRNGDFLNLRSGKTVRAGAVTLEDIPFEGNNSVTQMEMGVEGTDTVLRLTMGWKSPFAISLSPYPDKPVEGKSNYQFVGNTLKITLDYTTYIDPDAIIGSFDGSPVLSGTPSMERIYNKERNIYQYQLTLPLNQQSRYYGAHATWEDNTLVIRFNHPPTSSGTLNGVTIMVDPGHGGADNGTMAGSDVLEKDVNLLQGLAVADALRELGATVILTREGDTTSSIESRIEMAHAYQVDMYISCHHNSAGSNAAPSGIETYFNAPFSQPLAYFVHQQVSQYMTDRGVRGYNFLVAREKQFPSILIEFGYLSNPNDEALAQDPSHRDSLARAVAQGVLDYYDYYN